MGRILVKNLGKAYKQYPNRFSRLKEWLIPGSHTFHEKKWILQDINFEVKPGEAVGIIGINGAGKSTLLKLITGTIQPTTGSVEMTGRVASMLELGMGFHPDFTGRQNVYMAGQLLGMAGEEITELMPEIEEFAEIGDYIDQPVRVYSSGMQVRLAFSVATAIRPDILIIDEALSVGDAYFQHKSFDRIRKFRKEGTTLLLVSHDKSAIQSICDRAILLNSGKVVIEGQPIAVMDYYNALLASHQNQSINTNEGSNGYVQTISGTGDVKIENLKLLDINDDNIEILAVGQFVKLQVCCAVINKIPELVVGFLIKDRLGQAVYGTNTYHLNRKIVNPLVGNKYDVTFDMNMNLGPGTYSVTIALHSGDGHLVNNYEWRELALVFQVLNTTDTVFTGVVWLDAKVNI